MNKLKFANIVLSIIFCLTCGAMINFAQTTAFTYQGKLTDGGVAANATYDMQFKLFDAATNGTQIGSSVNNPTVQVTSGVFTVQLDFGATAFSGADSFLEINVRPANSSGNYTQLLPRQRITSAPYAIQALNAANATTAVTANNLTVSASGNFIQNTNSQQAASNFNISGNGTAGGTFSANYVNAATAYFIGNNRVLSNTGYGNLFAGVGAGSANTEGEYNSFFGAYAGKSNTTGTFNSFFGNGSGYNNTSGSLNSFFGESAGDSNTTGSFNSFFGESAGQSNTTGSFNSFFGEGAGLANETGSNNSFFGKDAGYYNNSGSYNSSFGFEAGKLNSTGNYNNSFGYQAGRSNANGSYNNFFGYQAGYNTSPGAGNGGNNFFGHSAGYNNTTGIGNNFIGLRAGETNQTGSLNTIIGDRANVGSGDLTYATAIGATATVSTSNTIALGRSNGNDKVVIYGLGSAGSTALCRNASNQISTCSSSLRYKTNIAPFASGLSFINQLRPISFDWKDGGMKDVGFGAEDVARINPLFVNYNDKGEVEGVKYDRFSVLFVNAFKEQQTQIEDQRRQIEQQQKAIERQQRQIGALIKLTCASNSAADICRQEEK